MPFSVEYVMKRPSKEVEFPTEGSEKDKLAVLREDHNISSSVFFSEDGLTRTLRHTASDARTYNDFYAQAQLYWEKSKVVQACNDSNVDITMYIVENT